MAPGGPDSVMCCFRVFFPLLLLLLVSAAAADCPSGCTCDVAKKSVRCTQVGAFPVGIDVTTESLTITGNYSMPLGLRHVTNTDLQPLSALKTLVITHTLLESIDDEVFQGLTSLMSLDLTFNRVSKLGKEVFQPLTSLLFLYLTGNGGLDIPASSFQDLHNLKGLYMGSLGLDHLDPELFTNLGNLSYLDLSDNYLKELPDGVASDKWLPRLQVLDLSFNHLTTLKDTIAPLISRVNRVNLADNPWNCNCRLKWLKVHARSLFPAHSPAVLCHQPPSVRYSDVSTLPDTRLVCTPPTNLSCPPVPDTLEAQEVKVSCTVDGDPFPDVSWRLADNTIISGSDSQGRQLLQIINNTFIISVVAGTASNGSLLINVSNVQGMDQKTLQLFVHPTTTTTTTTASTTTTTTAQATTTTTAQATTTTKAKDTITTTAKDATTAKGDGLMMYVAAAGAGVGGIVIGAIVTACICKKSNSNKVEPLKSDNNNKV